MSDSHALDALKAHAKQLLALARGSDTTVIAALRKHLPRLAEQSDADIAANVKLADVQHAIAVQRNVKSWAELKRILEAIDPLQVQVERFLLAIREEQKDRAEELLAAHPGIAQYNIHAAAAACDDQAVAAFLQRDPALAKLQAAPNKAEPIIYACGTALFNTSEARAASNERCVKLLLDAGGDPNAFIMFSGGETESPIPALYFAANGNNAPATRMLLERGANPNDGESIFHAAERNNRECLELLVQYGGKVGARHEEWSNTPLFFIAGHKPFSRLCESSELGMRWLLEHGADPNVLSYTDDKYKTWSSYRSAPLHRIAEYGKSVDVARMLVEHGAIIDLPRGDSRTAYVLAYRALNEPVAQYLASLGANTELLSPADKLVAACLAADEPRARALISDNPVLMKTLSDEDQQTLALAAERGLTESVKLMASLGWDLSTEGEWGGTPLHQAAWHGRLAMTQLLVDLGAPVNFRDKTYGSSPIAWAAHGSVNARPGNDDDYVAVVEILLNAGSTREASYNNWNEAPERLASKPIVRLLKQRGFSA